MNIGKIVEGIVGSMKVGGDVSAHDYNEMKYAVSEVMEKIVGELELKVEVDFEYGWNGRYRPETRIDPAEYPEFEASGEKVIFKPAIATVDVSEIEEKVLEELHDGSGDLDGDEEELVRTPEFRRAIQEVIHSNHWELVDIEAELPNGNSIESDIQMKLQLLGNTVRIEYSMKPDDLKKIMKKVEDKADDWFPEAETRRDMADYYEDGDR